MKWSTWQKRTKFKNTKVQTAGRSFDSKLEAAGYQLLLLREKAGEIRNIRQQVSVYLTLARIRYVADYAFEDVSTGGTIHCEFKGFKTPVWALKRRLYEWYGPGPLEVYEGSHANPKLTEIIIPKATQ